MQLTQQEYRTIDSLVTLHARSLAKRYPDTQGDDLAQAGWCIALRAMKSVDRERSADDVRNYISRALKSSLRNEAIRLLHPATLPKSYEYLALSHGPIRPVGGIDTTEAFAEDPAASDSALAREVQETQRSRVDGDSLYGLADLIRRSCEGDPAVIEVLMTGTPSSVVAPRQNIRPDALRRKVSRAKHWLRANA